MSVEIKVPEVGESITEGILAAWEKQDGDYVRVDDPLYVLETDKVTMTINSEHSGRLKILVPEGETVQIGQVVAQVDTEATAPSRSPEAEAPATTEAASQAPSPGDSQPQTTAEGELDELAPSVRRLVAENQLDSSTIKGTGRGGRITKEDVLRHLAAQPDQPPGQPSVSVPAGAPAAAAEGPASGQRQTRLRMTPLRKRIAERLVQAQHQAAILTTFNEVDMTNVMEWRARYKEQFKATYGTSLGFMSFFIKASVNALQAVPAVNAQIDGDDIVQNHFYDIGVAVGTDRGLVVPVIRDADQLSFAEIEQAVADLAQRAQENKLTLDELTGGCFTVSNGGVYGSLLSTPILNPPQSGILGMHGIKKRPVVVAEEIVIRPMMYLALSYDHRLVDGRESVTFLRRVVECIENPERMLLQI